jgi:hypothetical protein
MALSIERTLPEELLGCIISLARPECLLNICRTSKTFNRLATPLLYSTLLLPDRDDVENQLLSLAYTIFSSPDHTPLVKTVIVPEWEPLDDEDVTTELKNEWPESIPRDTLENVLRAKCTEHTTNDEEAEHMYTKIRFGENRSAILALLLATLPNLQSLDIDFGMMHKHVEFATMLERLAKGAKPSDQRPKIKKFSTPLDVLVKGNDDKYPNEPFNLAPFFNLPNLHALYGWKMGENDHDAPDMSNSSFGRLEPRSCPVEHIELRCSKLHNNFLACILNAAIPGKLKTFIYEVGCAWAWQPVDHSAIMENLSAHRDSLEELCLSHEEYYPYENASDDDKPYAVSFVPFTVLKRLKVAPVFIWGDTILQDEKVWTSHATHEMLWKALPRDLEEFWIERTEQQAYSNDDAASFIPDCILPALHLLVQQKAGEALPQLKTLRIEFPLLRWEYVLLDALASLCAAAKAQGISCSLCLTDLPDFSGSWSMRERAWGWDGDVDWTECCQNQEDPKQWVDVAGKEDVGKMLREMKVELEEEKKRDESRKSGRKRNGRMLN